MDVPRGGARPGSARRAVDAAHPARGRTVTALAAAWVALVVAGAWRWRPPPSRAVVVAAAASRTRTRRPVLPALLAVAGFVLALVWPPLAFVAVGSAVAAPRVARRRAERGRRLAIQRQLPDVVDLLVVAIAAGLTPALAVERLAFLAPEPFSAAFAEIERRT